MTQSFKSPERIFRAIYIGGGVRVRARASADNLISEWLRSLSSRVPATVSPSIAELLPSNGNWRSQPVERWTPFVSVPGWLRRTFPTRRDMLSGIIEFLRAIQAPGSLVLRAFVQHPQKSDGRFFVGFQFSPAFRSSVAAHVPNMKQKDARSHEQCTREYE